MLQYEVNFLTGAKKDILEIANYISNELYSPESAMRLIDKFKKAVNSLTTLPERYPVHESDTVKTIFRKMLVGNYLIFYIVKGKNVYIAFVIHKKQDFDIVLSTFKMNTEI
jgi:Plasmid stabilization system protein